MQIIVFAPDFFAVLAVNLAGGCKEHALATLQRQFSQIREAIAFAFPPPAINGLGVAGGFQMQLQDRAAVGLQELQKMVEEKVLSFSLVRIEEIVRTTTQRELDVIVRLGWVP